MIIVTDDADRENEGDLIMATGKVSSAAIGFMIRYTSGVICVSVPGGRLDELQLPLMVDANTESMRTAFTVSVDAAQGVTTGISVADRTRTIRSLADPQTSPADLARLAGCAPAGVLAEIVNDDGTMAHLRNDGD